MTAFEDVASLCGEILSQVKDFVREYGKPLR